MILLGNRTVAEVISLNKVLVEWGGPLTQWEWCPYKKKLEHRHAHRENILWRWKQRWGNATEGRKIKDCLQAHRCQEGGSRLTSSQMFKGPKPRGLWHSSFLLKKPPSLRSSLMAALQANMIRIAVLNKTLSKLLRAFLKNKMHTCLWNKLSATQDCPT